MFESLECNRTPLVGIVRYHPGLFFDGHICGYLLIKGDDYRFVVTEGQHRIGCLAASASVPPRRILARCKEVATGG